MREYVAGQLIASLSEHGESAWWDERRGLALFMDCWNPVMWTYDPEKKESRKVSLEFTPMAIVGCRDGGYVGASSDTVYKLDRDFRIVRTIRKWDFAGTGSRFNDCKCGPDGAFYLGTCGKPGDSNLFLRLNPDGSEEILLDHVGVSNGFAWAKDQKTLYYTDTIHGEIYAYDIKAGKLSGKRTVYHSDADQPDGFCIDENDDLWVAMWAGGGIKRIDPRTGEVTGFVKTETPFSTACVFGGKDMRTLYITSSRLDLTGEQKLADRISGNVFSAETEVKGQSLFYGDF